MGGGYLIEPFNGATDHYILKKFLFSKYSKITLDNRIVEKYFIPFLWMNKIEYFGPCWFHYGPIKLGMKLNEYYSIDDIISSVNKSNDIFNKKECWINGGVNIKNLIEIKNIYQNNKKYFDELVEIMNNKDNIKNQKHQKVTVWFKNNS